MSRGHAWRMGVAVLLDEHVGLLAAGQTKLVQANKVASHFMILLKFTRQMQREEMQSIEDAWLFLFYFIVMPHWVFYFYR